MFLQGLASLLPGLRGANGTAADRGGRREPTPIAVDPDAFNMACTIRINNSRAQNIEARICHCNRGFVRIVSPQWILAESRVEVVFGRQSVNGRVTYCTAQNDSYAIGVDYGQPKYRCDPRIPVDLEAKLFVPGAHAPMAIGIFDVSAAGLGLVVPSSLVVGSQVTVEVPDGKIVGAVCYCMRTESSYRVGFAMERFTPTAGIRSSPHTARRDQIGEKVLSSALAKFQSKKRGMDLLAETHSFPEPDFSERLAGTQYQRTDYHDRQSADRWQS